MLVNSSSESKQMAKAKVFKFVKQFYNYPKESDFQLVEEELEPLKDGEFLAVAQFLSVDSYMRAYSRFHPIGSTFTGGQIAKIEESKNPKFPVGKYVFGQFGWRTHTISDGSSILGNPTYVLPDFGELPLSFGVGILGMPGLTAYFGLLEVCQPKEGQTVMVSGADGTVGSIVGQIAKIIGCKVIGIAGSAENGKKLVNELGFDGFINCNSENSYYLYDPLKIVAPTGVDHYFDNVGGNLNYAVLNNMKPRGRIAVCGDNWGYNNENPKYTVAQFPLGFRELRMEGVTTSRWKKRWMEGIMQLLKWIKEGKLKYTETVTHGFENTPKAFISMLKGEITGKAVVKV